MRGIGEMPGPELQDEILKTTERWIDELWQFSGRSGCVRENHGTFSEDLRDMLVEHHTTIANAAMTLLIGFFVEEGIQYPAGATDAREQ